MRLRTLVISGFRGFSNRTELDLDADVIIMSGVNGSGKTSVFDAILWCLCGSVDRLSGGSSSLVSEYSPSGEARVEIVLRDDSGSNVTVVRRYDGQMHLTVQHDTKDTVAGPAADSLLIDLLWPDAGAAADPVLALTRSLTRATYLQQDAVREFVDADTEQDRFQVIGELVGVGRVAELQRQLESSRNQWNRATTTLRTELHPLTRRRDEAKDRLTRLPDSGELEDTESQISAWFKSLRSVIDDIQPLAPSDSVMNADLLERLLAELNAAEQTHSRKLAAYVRLADHLRSERPAAPDSTALELAISTAELQQTALSDALAEAEQRAADRRRMQVEENEHDESLRALAQLALQNLGDRCPVCEQTYDQATTRIRLEGLIRRPSVRGDEEHDLLDDTQDASGVAKAARELSTNEQALAKFRASLREVQKAAERHDEWGRELENLIHQTGIPRAEATSAHLARLITESQNRSANIRDLRRRGEQVALSLARTSERAQRTDLERQLAELNETVAEREATIKARDATAELATDMINELRAASSSVVGRQLDGIEPLLQRIFATVDPHPTFRVVGFITRMSRGRGSLWTTLDDPLADKTIQDPSVVLSSSQLNVLAVSIFLALNLAIPTLPLQVIALDDPLQSLDTLNLLGLADLLRRIKATRQVLVSTHDERLANLLVRKLRPVSTDERTIQLALSGWTSAGPTVNQREIPPDTESLRLIASA